MAELVHVYLGGDGKGFDPPYTITTQSHIGGIPHAAVLSKEGNRVALFRGDDWEDARKAAEEWVADLIKKAP